MVETDVLECLSCPNPKSKDDANLEQTKSIPQSRLIREIMRSVISVDKMRLTRPS